MFEFAVVSLKQVLVALGETLDLSLMIPTHRSINLSGIIFLFSFKIGLVIVYQ